MTALPFSWIFCHRGPRAALSRVFYSLWYALRSLLGSLLSRELPLSRVAPFVLLRVAAVIGYAWGCERDSWTGPDDEVYVCTSKGLLCTVKPSNMNGDDSLGVARLSELPATTHSHSIATAVVVPVLLSSPNDNRQLRALLDCLGSQVKKPDHIIVVDDASPDIPARASFQGVNVTVVRLSLNRGPAAARNVGIDQAVALAPGAAQSGKLVVLLTDLDCLPLPDWVERGVNAVLAHRPSLSQADSVNAAPLLIAGTTLSSCPEDAVDAYHDFYGTLNPRLLISPAGSTTVRPLYAPTCNLVLYLGSPHSQKKLPRFNESFREASMEDVLFSLEAWGRRNIDFEVVEQMQVEHIYPGAGSSFFLRLALFFKTFRKVAYSPLASI